MKAKTFRGGIHPKEYKELSNQCPITPVFPASKTVTIPVTMGGAPNQPVVGVGDEVAKGQIIANGEGFMNCPVHSSVSGKVISPNTKLGNLSNVWSSGKIAAHLHLDIVTQTNSNDSMWFQNLFQTNSQSNITLKSYTKDNKWIDGGQSFNRTYWNPKNVWDNYWKVVK